MGVFYGIGVGPGDPRLLTLRAVEVLRAVDAIFHVAGPRSRESISLKIVESVEGCREKCEELVFSMSNNEAVRAASVQRAAARIAEVLREGRSCAFATIGDPLIYSTFSYVQRVLRQLLPTVAIEVVPGITSFQAAAARSGSVLVEDEEVLTVVPRWRDDERHRAALAAADTAVALKTYHERNDALAAIERHMQPEALLYAARVGQAAERIESRLDAIRREPIDYLSLIVARRHGSHD